MKIRLISLMFLLTVMIPYISSAAPKTVTVDWTISDYSNVQSYKMYMSYSSDMGNKILACEINDPTATSLACSVNIDSYPVYFTIAASSRDGKESSSSVEEVAGKVLVSPPMRFRILSSP